MLIGLITPGDGDQHTFESPRDPFDRWSAGTLGMTILLISLGVLFAASLVGVLIIRFTKFDQWPPPGLPPLPATLWISTVLILISSVTIQIALSAARRGAAKRLTGALLATSLLGLLFVVSQVASYLPLFQVTDVPDTSRFYFASFVVLTALHGLHVVGGLIPLGVVTLKAIEKRYTPENHAGVGYVTMYWHFLDIVWVILFVFLYLLG